jgi:hypothetical protein
MRDHPAILRAGIRAHCTVFPPIRSVSGARKIGPDKVPHTGSDCQSGHDTEGRSFPSRTSTEEFFSDVRKVIRPGKGEGRGTSTELPGTFFEDISTGVPGRAGGPVTGRIRVSGRMKKMDQIFVVFSRSTPQIATQRFVSSGDIGWHWAMQQALSQSLTLFFFALVQPE